MISENIFVGIDVAKATLDVSFGVTGKVITFSNTPEGHDSLSAALASYEVTLVILEATGNYEVPVACVLQAAGLPVAIVRHVISPKKWAIWGSTPESQIFPAVKTISRFYTPLG